jgi:hypothetical protein
MHFGIERLLGVRRPGAALQGGALPLKIAALLTYSLARLL